MNQVNQQISSEPTGTYIRGVVLELFNIGVEVGRSMERQNALIHRLNAELESLKPQTPKE